MLDLTIPNFPHNPPNGYCYEFEKFNSTLISIWLRSHYKFVHTGGDSTRTIWGFYSPKKNQYYSPINSSKCGDKVDISATRNYTAMLHKQTPLEKAFS